MPLIPRRLLNAVLALQIALATLLTLATSAAHAVELIPFTGYNDVTPISGCCQHLAPSLGYGILARITKVSKVIGDIELGGFSDFRYSEGSVAKYLYLIGSGPQTDPISGAEVTVTRYTTMTLSLSYGLGFFSHNTKTTQYSLPALNAGLLAFSRFNLSYLLSDVWSLTSLVTFGLGYSESAMNFNLGYALGASYRF